MKSSFLQKLSAGLVALLLAAPSAFGIGSEFYDHTTYPSQGSAGSSAAMRAELDLIEAGFGKLPTLTGNGGNITAVNAGGTAIEAITTTGTGSGVRATSPTLVTPNLGTPSALVGTNITGTAAGLTAGTVTTNANLTGPITSTGNATAVAAQTGTGSTFVMQASPTLTTPNIGTPSAGVATNLTGLPLTTGVTGTLPVANGGTGVTSVSAIQSLLGIATQGHVQLTKSGANLLLSPYNGNLMIVNGAICSVPDAGVSLAPTGLSATTLYYIYATCSAGVVNALEASTTAYAVSTTEGNKGNRIKTGDDARALVGMAYVKTAATFADSATQRFVRSWFNDPGIGGTNQLVGNVSYSVAAYAEISTSIRVEFLTWAGETVVYGLSGTATNNGAGNSSYTGVGFDTTTNPEYGMNLVYTPSASVGTPVGVNGVKTALAEGYHYTTMIGRPDVGTSTWSGTTNAWGCNLSISTKK